MPERLQGQRLIEYNENYRRLGRLHEQELIKARERLNGRKKLKIIYDNDYADLCADVIEESWVNTSKSGALRTLENLLTGSPINTDVLAQLKEFSEKGNWVKDSVEKVEHGKNVLRNLFNNPHHNGLLSAIGNPRLLIYGSLQYGDPRNLDADVFGIVDALPPALGSYENEQVLYLNDELLLPAWEGVGTEPHISVSSAPVLLSVDRFVASNIQNGFSQVAIDQLDDVSIALTGEALFEQDNKWATKFQNDLMDRINQMPLVRAYVNTDLEDALSTRKERRRAA